MLRQPLAVVGPESTSKAARRTIFFFVSSLDFELQDLLMLALLSLVVVLSTAPFAAAAAKYRTYTIKNQCPQPIDLYTTGFSEGPLAANGGQIQKTFLADWDGYIYTPSNGGNLNKPGMTSVGFRGNVCIRPPAFGAPI